jgi:alanyl-tRNA synthetase
VYGLDPDRLYVTYFEGDTAGGLEPDTEAKDLWLAAGVAEDHILPGNFKVCQPRVFECDSTFI